MNIALRSSTLTLSALAIFWIAPAPLSADEIAGYTNQPGYKVSTEPSYLTDESNTRVLGMKMLQSLAYLRDQPQGVFAQFIDIDEMKGTVAMNPETGMNETGTVWRIERGNRLRGHRIHHIRTMSESHLHGGYLDFDSANGRVKVSADKSPTSALWIRYMGKVNGFDAYTFQSLAHSEGRWDFAYLEVDRKTGRLQMSRQRTEGCYWYVRNADDMPPMQ